jgi:hypothetical protein
MGATGTGSEPSRPSFQPLASIQAPTGKKGPRTVTHRAVRRPGHVGAADGTQPAWCVQEAAQGAGSCALARKSRKARGRQRTAPSAHHDGAVSRCVDRSKPKVRRRPRRECEWCEPAARKGGRVPFGQLHRYNCFLKTKAWTYQSKFARRRALADRREMLRH